MRAIVLCLSLLLLGAVPAYAQDEPVTGHTESFGGLESVPVAKQVGQARLQSLGVGVSPVALPTTWCGEETTIDDTADATFVKTLPQFKVVYAYPHDRDDRFAEFKDALQADVSLIEQFVSSQPRSTRAPRFDLGTLCGPKYLDIQTVALPGPRSMYVQNLGAVKRDVLAQVNQSPGGKRNYLIIADTLSSSDAPNGVGEFYMGSISSWRPDISNVHNDGKLTSIIWYPDAAAPQTGPQGWSPEALLHEMTHNMGAVQWGAPHSSQPPGGTRYAYSHCWDGLDIMCYQDGPAMSHPYDATRCEPAAGAMPQTYDCGQDDYFNPSPAPGTYLASHWNVYDIVFMAECGTLPAGTCLTTGPTDPPVNAELPSIAGTPATGELLTSDKGVWDPPATSYSYQWLRNGAPIVGATVSTYRLGSADRDAMISVRVQGRNAWGSDVATSGEVGPSAARPPLNTAPPAVSGTAMIGWTLSATAGAWSPSGSMGYAYQWQRGSGDGEFTAIPGAVSATYRLVAADEGALVRVRVTALNPDGSESEVSAAVGPVVAPAPVVTRKPAIIGAPKTGSGLIATTGTWSPAATGYSIQWQRDTGNGYVDIDGARTASFRLGRADIDAKLRVRVTATSGSQTVEAVSDDFGPVAPQPPKNIGVPRVGGGVLVGGTLSATAGAWSPAASSYSYQWQRDGVDIAGATRTTYKLTADDAGAILRLRVRAVNTDGTADAYSLPIGPIRLPAAATSISAGSSASLRTASGALLASASVSGATSHALLSSAPLSARADGALLAGSSPAGTSRALLAETSSAGASRGLHTETSSAGASRGLLAGSSPAGTSRDLPARASSLLGLRASAAPARASAGSVTVRVRRAPHASGRLRVTACDSVCTPLRRLGRRPLTLKLPGGTKRVRVAIVRG